MLLHDRQELSNLIRLGFAAHFLQIHQLGHIWMHKNMVTSFDSIKAKSERFAAHRSAPKAVRNGRLAVVDMGDA